MCALINNTLFMEMQSDQGHSLFNAQPTFTNNEIEYRLKLTLKFQGRKSRIATQLMCLIAICCYFKEKNDKSYGQMKTLCNHTHGKKITQELNITLFMIFPKLSNGLHIT